MEEQKLLPDRAGIETHQIQKLNALLGAIVPANPFYTRKFKEAGCRTVVEELDEFSRRVPFTTKPELARDQEDRPPYGSNLTFMQARYTRCHQTSGTSGAPLRWLDTAESWDWMLRHWELVFMAAGVTQKDRVFCAFSFGPFIGFWLAFEAASRMGCMALPGGGLGSAQRLRFMLDHNATVLCCTPTYAMRLAEVAASESFDLGKCAVKRILVAGEPGGSIPAVRHRIESLWRGAKVFDHHGMTEVGPVTFQCPDRPGVLHVMETGYLPEIVDPVCGQPTAPGDSGELVLTTLGRTGSPLLRYRTGDVVKRSQNQLCACGRAEMALEGGILGRTDDMVVVRGVNVYPSAVEEIVRACGGIAEYQVRVSAKQSMAELSMAIEPAEEGKDPGRLAAKIQSGLQTTLSLRIPVSVAAPGSLPRFEMKARRWVREG